MHEALEFRRAEAENTPRILEIILQAQAQMRAAGSRQWQDGYPAARDIVRDIARGYGYVLCNPGVIAYGAVVLEGEPAYKKIEGEWLTDGAYVVVHRLAVCDAEKGRGVATEFMRRTESLARAAGIGAVRVDTNFDNLIMQRLLRSEGFVFCGKIQYASGERLAFEKRL